jgi:exocyst complex component 2
MLPPSQEIWYGWHAEGTYLARKNATSLTCFKQATLEIEFMHQTLGRYVTPPAAKTLSDLYNKISQAYSRRQGDENLQQQLDGVKKILADTRRSTGVDFLCFRTNKEKKSSSSRHKEKENGHK